MILAEIALPFAFVDFRVTVVEAPFTAFLGTLIVTFLPLTFTVATFLEAVVALTIAAPDVFLAAVALNPTFTDLPGATTTIFLAVVSLLVPSTDFVETAAGVAVLTPAGVAVLATGAVAVALGAGVILAASAALTPTADTTDTSLPSASVVKNAFSGVLPSWIPVTVNVTERDSSKPNSLLGSNSSFVAKSPLPHPHSLRISRR